MVDGGWWTQSSSPLGGVVVPPPANTHTIKIQPGGAGLKHTPAGLQSTIKIFFQKKLCLFDHETGYISVEIFRP